MRKPKSLIIFFWGGILALLFTGIILYFNLHHRAAIGDTIVVRVNDRQMSAKEFAEKLAENLQDYDALLAKDTHVVDFAKNKIVEDFVHDSLILDWAKRNKMSVSQDEVEKEVQKIRSNYPDDPSFKEALAHSQQSLGDWEDTVGQKLLQKKVFQVLAAKTPAPADDELKSYYNTNKEEFRVKGQVRIRQIVLDNEDTANRIYHSITPSASLEPLAKKYSIAPEAVRGGDVGWVEMGALDIFDKAFNMKVGQRAGVLKSPYGFHIIEVTGKRAEQLLPFDEVKTKIDRILRSNKEQAIYSAWLEEQLRISKVFKNEEAIQAIEVKPVAD
jgi:foldase protein PrsA